MKPVLVVAALELLGLLLLAGAAFVAAWTYVGLWAGLLGAAVVVLAGAWAMERNFAAKRS